MTSQVTLNSGSFRDPVNRVYEIKTRALKDSRVLRGLNEVALENYRKLSKEKFFQNLVEDRHIITTKEISSDDSNFKDIIADGWVGVLEHEVVPFITYPYEWTFNMLKDAALLQLNLIEKSIENGWVLKDASPYNIQWIGSTISH